MRASSVATVSLPDAGGPYIKTNFMRFIICNCVANAAIDFGRSVVYLIVISIITRGAALCVQ
jgi:hypothetical protein